MGQLGVGRVTGLLVPTVVMSACPLTGEPFREAAAGWAHALARTKSGAIFSWGFNALGSLGLGDSRTRFTPEHVTLTSTSGSGSSSRSTTNLDGCSGKGDGKVGSSGEQLPSDDNKENCRRSSDTATKAAVKAIKIDASGNFSGALTSEGQLLTWGCGYTCRQGHVQNNGQSQRAQDSGNDDGDHAFLPRCVEHLERVRVADFALCGAGGVALVPLRVSSIYPVSGPMESGCRVTIHGDAFWDSPDVIVTFAPVSQRAGHKPIAARSAVGKFVLRGSERGEESGNDGRRECIECLAPCFASPEEVYVEVSLMRHNACTTPVKQIHCPKRRYASQIMFF